MELEFDKEIDALMRGKGVLVGDSPPSGPHPDADEIAAFAENALPERARALHMAHIADCTRCRKILSNIIAMNAEAEPELAAATVPVLEPAVEASPWYRKLFIFPNLAYVMGGLVLVFGGLIGISVYQSSSVGETAVSQVTESEAARGPMAPTEPQFSNSAVAANSMANTATSASNSNSALAIASPAANAASNSVASAGPRMNREGMPLEAAPTTSDVTTASELPAAKPAQPMAAAPPPPAGEVVAQKDADLAKEDDAKERRNEESEKSSVALRSKKKEISLDGADANNIPRTQAGGVAKSVPGPTRDMQQTFPNRADNTYELKSRRVGGRDFQFRNGAWYDTSYRGQATTNVRRGSDEYKQLDTGLRRIAESLNGVVVTVWEGKAYRIQ